MRTVILHAHIFKNAGTTLDSVLDKNFGRCFIDDRNDELIKSQPSYLANLINGNQKIKAVSSHSVHLPLFMIDDIDLIPVLMLRHPILRSKSVYDFERQQKSNTPGAINAKKMDFKEYVRWRMNPSIGNTIRNYQCDFISKNLVVYNLTDQAKVNYAVEQFKLHKTYGIVEMFDQSMKLIKEALVKKIPNFDIAYEKKNVLNDSSLNEQQRIASIRDELGEVYNLLIENNRLDLELYQACRLHQEQRCI